MSTKARSFIGILYYLAFAVVGVIGFFAADGFLGQALLVNLSAVALIGIVYFICFELLEDDGALYTVFKVIKTILSIAGFVFIAMIFFTGYFEQSMNGAMRSSFSQALIHATVFFPLLFILLRGTVYSFTLENFSEIAQLIITLTFPIICYILSVFMLMISTVWSLVVLGVLWLFLQIFIKGYLNAFERTIYNLIYYGAFLALGLFFIEQGNLLAVFAYVALACCFFFFLAMDLCKETTAGYWIFNVLGILLCGVFIVVGLVLADTSGIEGLTETLSCGFVDALKNALYFMPIVYVCLRAPMYKLAKESEWEDGLTDVAVSFILPVISYILSVLFLLIGFIYPTIIVTVILVIAFVIMFLRDDYPYIPDAATEIRASTSDYIRSIKIIED